MAFWKSDGAEDRSPAARGGSEGRRRAEDPESTEGIGVVLGPGVELDGRLTLPGTARIDARFKGSIATDGAVVVGDRADVQADITCGAAVVHGSVHGSIRARDAVEIHPRATVRGEIEAPSLSMERGAVFEGRSRVTGSSRPGPEVPADRSGADLAASPGHG